VVVVRDWKSAYAGRGVLICRLMPNALPESEVWSILIVPIGVVALGYLLR
jgi:hypothetical protein